MTPVHNDEFKNRSECNLLHDIINPPKRAKKLNRHYFPILHGCMNTRKGKVKIKKIRILLEIGFISTIVMGRLVKKLPP